MATPFSTPFSPLSLPPIRNPSFPQLISVPTKSPIQKPYAPNFPNPNSTTIRRRKLSSSATSLFLLAEATTPIDDPTEMIPQNVDSTSTIVSGLLLAAFVGLSILTIGVIYIAVTDFLQKRESEKFKKKEEAAAGKKKRGRKGVVARRGQGGPRGFGQKVEDDDDVDD